MKTKVVLSILLCSLILVAGCEKENDEDEKKALDILF
jgi:ABC-type Fe3+-citrate transport system substrate-binding protein